MERGTFFNIILLIILILAQVLICNHIHLFNIAVPFIFIYVIVRLPLSLSHTSLLTWGFVAGLIVDIFSDTPGVNALACTLLAGSRNFIFYLYIPKDDRTQDVQPSIANLGFAVYAKYLITLCLFYCLAVFFIEYLSFYYVKEILECGLSSALLTFLLLLGIDSLMRSKKD